MLPSIQTNLPPLLDICQAKKAHSNNTQDIPRRSPPPVSAKPIQITWNEDPQQHQLDTIIQIVATERPINGIHTRLK